MDFQKELIAEYDREIAKTRKMIEAIPDNADYDYKPNPKSMSLGRLAGHICDFAGDWPIHTLTLDKLEFAADHKFEPFSPKSKQEILKKYDGKQAEAKAALAATTGTKWDEHWKFIWGGQTFIDEPRQQVFRDVVLNHMVHHRGQLSVYLRLIGAKVPGMYGPSADEM
jgi:uncharacterized damage-inducible protein DinB